MKLILSEKDIQIAISDYIKKNYSLEIKDIKLKNIVSFEQVGYCGQIRRENFQAIIRIK